MRNSIRTNRFKKDVELAGKRGKNLAKLRMVMEKLIAEKSLQARHGGSGDWGRIVGDAFPRIHG